jgi:hypothetical protein
MMRPSLLFACVALWLGAAAPLAADDRFEIRLPGWEGVMLGVVGGEVRVVRRTTEDMDWTLSPDTGIPLPIRVIAPKKYKGKYLAYDPQAKGKDKGAVFLANKWGEGTKWLLERVKGEKEKAYTIQAASGKYKGWYLDVEEKGKEHTDDKGKKVTAYRVFLSEKPKEVPKWVFYEIGR